MTTLRPLARSFAALLCAVVLAPLACKRAAAAKSGDLMPKVASPAAAPSAVAAAMTVKPLENEQPKKPPQPPAQPCVAVSGDREPPLADLLEQAARDFEHGRYEDALECGREATRVDPTNVAAHHFRGAALSELGQLDEARTAYARALALDPDDPEVLRSAADLHVRRLGSRDDLELALVYVHRALPRAQKSRDRALLKEIYLLQAMALDDLGRPADALAAATRATELDPKDREARRERGVALFELCKFDQSKVELARLAAEEPDAWAEHYLGLISERAGDDASAQQHFARANKLDPDAFKQQAQAPAPFFSQIVQDEVAKLPADIRAGLSRSEFLVEDLPEVGDLVATDPPLSPGILGLFRPPPEGAPNGARPAIILYRRNLARAAHDESELRREVRDTLMHEVGHLNGEDDDQLRDRGL